MAAPETPTGAPGPRWLRLWARLLDVAIVGYVFGFIVVEVRGRLFEGDPFATRPLAGSQDPVELLAILFVMVLVVDVVPTAWFGRTPGKLMLGLRTVRSEDRTSPPGLVRALFRALLIFGGVALPVVGIGAPIVLGLAVLVAAEGRGIHDRLSGTAVVTAPRPEPARRPEGGHGPIALPPHPDDE